MYQRFAGDGLEVVYVGALETEDACRAWREEFQLEFPVIADTDGTLFRAFTNGWVPWSVLIGPQGKVIFSENEFDESGFSSAIQRTYQQPAAEKLAPRRAHVPAVAPVADGRAATPGTVQAAVEPCGAQGHRVPQHRGGGARPR